MRALADLAGRLRSRFLAGPSPRETALQVARLGSDDAKALLEVLQSRQSNGLTTELRQLHVITDLTQVRALRALSMLEETELVTVNESIQDFLRSTVHVGKPREKVSALGLTNI